MSMHADALDSLQGLIDDGWISDVLFEVKSGKEATVYCCRGGERATHTPLVAAKVYAAIETRSFQNDAIYQTGRMHLARNSRFKRAAENKSTFGRKVQYGTWMHNEWETLRLLHDVGADVPKPLACAERAILMSHVGNADRAAPRLHEVELSRDDATRIAQRLLWNVELMLHYHRVHGDLSPYNLLVWEGDATIIDLPQAIDPRLNPAAHALFSRDVQNVCDWAARCGVRLQAQQIIHDLWSRFVIGEIG